MKGTTMQGTSTTVQQDASLHPAVVEEIDKTGVIPVPAKAPRRRGPNRKPATPPVHTHIRWPEEYWQEAQSYVRTGERLVIISDTEAKTVYVK